ncbi:MAG TPA: pantoate--beta-alanine ligase [Flavobacterium sp.]|jgi:pantoate--beta-alanine ligase
MLIFNRQAALSQHLASVSGPGSTIGFVPTMGALHEGHLSLLKESVAGNIITVISIFVNPTQFNNPEDLERYPRTPEADIEKIAAVSSSIIVFTPSVDDIYEGRTVSQHFDFGGLENQMEGKFRPGHFDGVGTIVKRLFEIVKPTNAYFGEKDFQQLQIVRKMTEISSLPVNIIGCPIFRESNGLAMSSRNERLTPGERKSAGIIYETLKTAKVKYGTESAAQVRKYVDGVFQNVPGFELEYFEIAEEETLLPSNEKHNNKKYRAFIAVFVNNIRLIDTIPLN